MSEKKATRVGYGEALVALGAENDKVVVLDADLSCSTMTNGFAKAYPDRFFDCGIAEANMVTMAAGLSSTGLIPFCSTFAVFASRCYEQIRNGVCYPKLNVKFAFTHAGITVGEDGATHQAIEDIAIMRALPGMTILCPCDAEEAGRAVRAAAAMEGPVYLRLARLATPVFSAGMPFEIGKANIMREGGDVALITCGLMVEACMNAPRSCWKRRAFTQPSSTCTPSSRWTKPSCASWRLRCRCTPWKNIPSSAAWAMRLRP